MSQQVQDQKSLKIYLIKLFKNFQISKFKLQQVSLVKFQYISNKVQTEKHKSNMKNMVIIYVLEMVSLPPNKKQKTQEI